MRFATCLIFLLLTSTHAVALHQCSETEERIFSFETKTKKILSLCKGTGGAYLVLRLGRRAGIDLQYPERLDASSWQQFSFESRHEAGTKPNTGFSNHLLTFLHGDAAYALSQDWDGADGRYAIVLEVERGGKTFSFKGLRASQEGSLLLLEAESDKLQNMAD